MKEKVIIVGAGMSGLTLAHSLAAQGYSVEVIEKRRDPILFPTLDPRSINLTLSTRGLAALERLGLAPAAIKQSVTLLGRRVHREDGRQIFQAYGTKTSPHCWAITRQDLQRLLLQSAAKQNDITLSFESEFLSLDKASGAVTLRRGEVVSTETPRFLVGADGAFSRVRQLMHRGEMADFRQEFFGWSYKQFDIYPEHARAALEPSAVHVWPRRDALLIAIANRDGSFNANLFLSRRGETTFRALKSQDALTAFLTERFGALAACAPDIARQLAANPENGIVRTLSSPWHLGDRVVLVGDACHAMYHFYAQGLNASLEDCAVLDESLRGAGGDLNRAFTEYETRRKRNTDALSELSRGNFETLRVKCASYSFHAGYLIEQGLHRLLGARWEPIYPLVTHGRVTYREAEKILKRRRLALRLTGLGVAQRIGGVVLWMLSRFSRPKRPTIAEGDSSAALARLSLLLVMLVAATHASARPLKKYIVGMASTLADVGSNSSIPHGDFFRKGAKLALEHSRERLAKKGIAIELRDYDYGNSRLKVMELAKEAVASDLIAVIGYNFSDHVLLAAPIHQKGHLALITPTATADSISELGDYVHPMCFSNSFQSTLLAKIATTQLHAKRIAAIVAQDCTYCQDLEHSFERELGKTPVVTFPILKGDTNFDGLIEKVRAAGKFDLIFIPDHELTAAKVAMAFLNAEMRGPFLGGDGWANYGTRIFSSMFAGSKLSAFATNHWHERIANPISRRFVKEYSRKFGMTPNMTAALAYDSTLFLVQSMLSCKAPLTRESLEICLDEQKAMEGVTGHYEFTPHRAPKKGLVLMRFGKDGFEYYKEITP